GDPSSHWVHTNRTMQAPGRPGPRGQTPKSHDLCLERAGETSPMAKYWAIESGDQTAASRHAATGSGGIQRPDAKPGLVDLQRADPGLERRSRDPEPFGRSRGPEHPAAADTEGVLDHRLLLRGQSSGQPMSAVDLGPCGQPALVDRELVGVGDD